MRPEHTPVPWRAHERGAAGTRHVRCRAGGLLATVHSRLDDAAAEADARLIARAPTVTAAADVLLEAFGGDVPNWCREEFDELSRAVRDAYGREF